MSKTKQRITAILALIAMVLIAFGFSFSTATAYANSAPKRWYGSAGLGAVANEDCPLTVEHEDLDFFVSEYPKNYYEDKNEFLSYNGRVTAEYTFYNPTDEDITATLMFPFGTSPSYSYYDSADELSDEQLALKYDVTVDGEPIEKTLRHSYSNFYFNSDYYHYSSGDPFDAQTEIDRLRDELISTDFYAPDTRVTVYTYAARNLAHSDRGLPRAETVINADSRNTRIMTSKYYNCEENNALSLSFHVESGDDIIIIAIGEPLDKTLQWSIYDNGTRNKVKSGYIEFVSSETLTLYDFIMSYRSEVCAASEIDFYNAAIYGIDWHDGLNRIYIGTIEYFLKRLPSSLMRWYEYELTVPAGARVKNTVTAPIYPYIDGTGKYTVYGYTYLLSPAKSWAEFGSITITVHTNDYVVQSNVYFEEHDGGYVASLDRLPDDELYFYLCSEQIEYPYTGIGWWIIPTIILTVLAITFISVVIGPIIVVSVYVASKNKKSKNKTTHQKTLR